MRVILFVHGGFGLISRCWSIFVDRRSPWMRVGFSVVDFRYSFG